MNYFPMIALINLCILLTQLITLPLSAVIPASNYKKAAYKKYRQHDESERPYTLSWQTEAFSIGKSDSDKIPNYRMGYQQFDTTLTATIPCNTFSGLILSCGGVVSDINADDFGVFQKDSLYKYVMLSVGGYTLVLPRWNWSILCSLLTDPHKICSFNYNLYQIVICGKYKATDVLELTMGIINEAGLRQEKAWPLVGISYKPNEKTSLNLVYPNNFSFEYECSPTCRIGTSVRLVRFRKRLRQDSIIPKGIFEYENRGLEATLKIIPSPKGSLKLFGGVAAGHSISLADRRNHVQLSEKFDNSAYFGGNLVISF